MIQGIFSSKYYTITYNSELKIIVRFSDHFNDTAQTRNVAIDIVKTSVGFYTIRLLRVGISYTNTEDLILPYLKSILLIYPEIEMTVKSYKEATAVAVKTSTKALEKANVAEVKLNKRDEYIEMVDEIYTENKKLRTEIAKYHMSLNDAMNQLNNAKASMESSKKKAAEAQKNYNVLKDKFLRLKSVLDSI